ncbi:MAG TPA: FAD-dependent oxidoreductase [Candidatus Saccharimonadales bacterium]|nr:FAD-dependent oxidoreductase [Candidatus Saccharimonadales bacterium]
MYDVIIVGSGPAGLTAAIYTTRASLKTLVLAGVKWGGQLQLTSLVENFPGFPEGIQGPDLMSNMRKQAEHHGAEIVEKEFTHGDFSKSPFKINSEDGTVYESKAVILASGADARWLGVPGEEEKIGRGVSSCATCDAAFFKEKNVIVVGGGDSAMEEALVLSKSSKNVFLVHRKDEFRASQIMQDRVKETKNIHIVFNSQITEVGGEFKVQSVKIKTFPSDKSLLSISLEELDKIALGGVFSAKNLSKDETSILWELPIDGVFVAIGHIPNTKAFAGIELDAQGFIKVQNHFHTNVPGVFVAGDVHDRQYKQAITAAGFGSAAALEVEKWLGMQKAS